MMGDWLDLVGGGVRRIWHPYYNIEGGCVDEEDKDQREREYYELLKMMMDDGGLMSVAVIECSTLLCIERVVCVDAGYTMVVMN